MNLYNDDLVDDDDEDEVAATTAAPKTVVRSHKKKKVAKQEIPLSNFLQSSFADPKNGKLAARFVEKFIKKHPEVNFEQLKALLNQFSEKLDDLMEKTSPSTRLQSWEPPA